MIFFFLGYTTAKPNQFALQDGGSIQALNALSAVFGLFTRSIFHLFFISLFQVLNIHMVILVQLSILSNCSKIMRLEERRRSRKYSVNRYIIDE
jgi:hypothetical protein